MALSLAFGNISCPATFSPNNSCLTPFLFDSGLVFDVTEAEGATLPGDDLSLKPPSPSPDAETLARTCPGIFAASLGLFLIHSAMAGFPCAISFETHPTSTGSPAIGRPPSGLLDCSRFHSSKKSLMWSATKLSLIAPLAGSLALGGKAIPSGVTNILASCS